jgi:hypothetical protein
MAAFGLLPQPTGETEAAVKNGASFIDVISAPDFAACYRIGESDPNCPLMRYLLSPERIHEFFQLCANSDDRETHRKIVPILQTSNVALFSTFACDIKLTTEAFVLLEQASSDPKRAYGAGTLGRMFTRALDRWICDVGEVLRYSGNLFKTILEHLDNGVVFQILCNLTSEDRPQAAELIWHICRALFQTEFGRITLKKPRKVYFADDIDSAPLLTVARANGLYVVKQFFANLESEPRQFADFKRSLLDALAIEAIRPDFLDLAIILARTSPHQGLLDKLVRSLSDAREDRDRICRYVAACAKDKLVADKTAVDVVEALFAAGLRQADVTAILALVREAKERRAFVHGVREIMAREERTDPLFVAVCLGAQARTKDFEGQSIVREEIARAWAIREPPTTDDPEAQPERVDPSAGFEDAPELRPLRSPSTADGGSSD